MVKMTKNSPMEGLLEQIKNSAIWKSVLREAVLRQAKVYYGGAVIIVFAKPIQSDNNRVGQEGIRSLLKSILSHGQVAFLKFHLYCTRDTKNGLKHH